MKSIFALTLLIVVFSLPVFADLTPAQVRQIKDAQSCQAYHTTKDDYSRVSLYCGGLEVAKRGKLSVEESRIMVSAINEQLLQEHYVQTGETSVFKGNGQSH